MVQEGDPTTEFRLGLFWAADGKVDRAQRVTAIMLELTSRIVPAGHH
jgi:hypothetical protein